MLEAEYIAERAKIKNCADIRRMGTDSLAELDRIDIEADDAMHALYLRFESEKTKK